MLHQLLDQQLGHLDREGDEVGLFAEQPFEGDAKERRRLFGGVLTLRQLGDGGLGVGKEAEALAPLPL